MTETTILSESAVSEIETRANAASKGPWSQSALASAYIVGRHTDDFPVICALAEYEKDGTLYLEFTNAENNMTFLAHAREDIPTLCATVKHLRTELSTTKGQWAEMFEKLASALLKQDDLQSQLEQLRAENKRLKM